MRPARFVGIAAIALLASLAGTATSARAGGALPQLNGPDVPATTEATTVTAFEDEVFSCTESTRHSTIAVPSAYQRVVVEFSYESRTDPWDRLFGVTVGGAEVLRGTTPRTDFTVTKDITEFAAAMPAGGVADIGLAVGSYVGEVSASVRLHFYSAEPTAALVRPPAGHVIAPFALASLNGDGHRLAAEGVAFPAVAPAAASVEVTLSGHGSEEFWFGDTSPETRSFDVLVDGVVVTTATAMPYTYALLGFGNANANTACVGPGTSPTGDAVHPLMWWTAQRALDAAGVHAGVGEIPPYRATLDSAALALLAGDRTVEVVQRGGGARWITSLTFLLDD